MQRGGVRRERSGQDNSAAPAAPILEFSKAAATAPLKPKPELVSFLHQVGDQKYALPLACVEFASMPELSLINVPAPKNCGVLDGHALRIVVALKKRKARPSPPAICNCWTWGSRFHASSRSGSVKHAHNCRLQYIDVLPVKQPLGVAISSCVFWYSALATL